MTVTFLSDSTSRNPLGSRYQTYYPNKKWSHIWCTLIFTSCQICHTFWHLILRSMTLNSIWKHSILFKISHKSLFHHKFVTCNELGMKKYLYINVFNYWSAFLGLLLQELRISTKRRYRDLSSNENKTGFTKNKIFWVTRDSTRQFFFYFLPYRLPELMQQSLCFDVVSVWRLTSWNMKDMFKISQNLDKNAYQILSENTKYHSK